MSRLSRSERVMCAFPLLVATSVASGQSGTSLTIAAGSLGEAVRIDGILDESAWAGAPSIDHLTMVEPRAGQAASLTTRVRVLAGTRLLVIGVECTDDPSAIVAFARERDAELAAEDHVRILFDTHLNQRSGYIFAVNANGARYDALITDGGGAENKAWDTHWEAAAVRTERGWQIEIAIPIQSVSFREDLRAWGFNVERRVQRLLETDRWTGADPSVAFTQPARAGRLANLPAFVFGRGTTIRPSVLSGMRHSAAGTPRERVFEPSLDATQRVGSAVLASVTINTDFAETEVDTRRPNLTRFSLLYPEKRTFFVEGTDIFEFGIGMGERAPDVVPFFSRRIGLFSGSPVPIVAGVKVNGRAGQTSFGALGARTGVDVDVEPATMTSFRLRQNVLEESSVGVIAATGDPEGRGRSWMGGVDAILSTSRLAGNRSLRGGGWFLSTGRDGLTGDASAWGVALEYPNDDWNAALSWKHIGAAFDPSLAFVPRYGVDIGTAGATWRRRALLPGVRWAQFELHGRTVLDTTGRVEGYSIFTAPLHVLFESGDGVEFNVAPQGERLGEPFPIAPGVEIPAGDYDWVLYRFEGVLAAKRRLNGRASLTWGDFYNGSIRQWAASLVAAQSAAASLQVTFQLNEGDLETGTFTQRVIGSKLQVNVSPDFTINSFLQYDNQSKQLGSNTRVRYHFSTLGDLFLIHNHNVTDATSGAWRYQASQLLLKVQYAFRS